MISYICGKVVLERANFVVVDVNGIGYKVSTIAKISLDDGKEIKLFCHQHLREDCSDLYGFSSFEELELFEKLISVNGVGPKAAMTIMGLAPVEKIIESIISEDANFFQSASGVGEKASIKIIVDLKSKISDLKYSGNISAGINQDVYEGLETLGYKKAEIDQIIGKMPTNLESSEDKVRWCLKNLSKG
ncbi:MAG: Holliday junction branch migration protein RuvA [Candidatus Berkelbacteria bacterium]|nr:Holliday junction branch migration protein RuvA [Candidatus Berkelbacteria bacterium]